MSYIDELERQGICPDCGLLECECLPFVDNEPYPEPDEGREEKGNG
mgnify:CR=1 FL=1